MISADQLKLDAQLTRQQVNPADWDELLTRHANKFTALADELKQDHLAAKPAVQRLIDEYLAQARDITRLAERVCSEAYKRQWPTQESLNYLWEHQQIDINLTSRADPERPTLSGDFFTEYAVYDTAKNPRRCCGTPTSITQPPTQPQSLHPCAPETAGAAQIHAKGPA